MQAPSIRVLCAVVGVDIVLELSCAVVDEVCNLMKILYVWNLWASVTARATTSSSVKVRVLGASAAWASCPGEQRST